MPTDAAAANGKHFTADPFGCRGSGGVSDTADLCNRLVAAYWYVVRPLRISTGAVTSGCPLDCHRFKLRQVNLTYSLSNIVRYPEN